MIDLPPIALSVRQPWAWAIIYGGKDIENRSIFALKHIRQPCRRIAIHASQGITKDEYDSAAEFMAKIGVTCPPAITLHRGCLIGSVEVHAIVKISHSKWFFGPRGLALRNPIPIERVVRVTGQLGYFEWEEKTDATPPALLKWMGPSIKDHPELFNV